MNNERGIAAIAMDLDDLPLPYKFDVIALSNISNTALLEHIERIGIDFYNKSD